VRNRIRNISILVLLGLLLALTLSCKAAPTVTTPMPAPMAMVDMKAYTDELAIFCGAAQGASADQVSDEALSLAQMLRGEAGKDWQVGEAEPAILGGRQGRKLFGEYTHAPSGARHRLYLMGISGDSLSYAFVADAPLDEWDQSWRVFEAMLDGVRFGTE